MSSNSGGCPIPQEAPDTGLSDLALAGASFFLAASGLFLFLGLAGPGELEFSGNTFPVPISLTRPGFGPGHFRRNHGQPQNHRGGNKKLMSHARITSPNHLVLIAN